MEMKVKDLIANNDNETEVILQGRNPACDYDGWTEHYFQGKLGNIPEKFWDCRVLNIGWLLDAECNSISIPYQKGRA